MRSILPWLLVAVLAGLLLRGLLPSGRQPASGVGRVVRVVDGDTIVVRLGGRYEKVRYIGMDTPESVKPGVPVQCYAKRASHENARLVAGRRVRLVVGDEPRDRYGRLLAYVYRASDGRFVNAALVSGGFARTLTIPPNDRFAPRLAALQHAAQAAGRGLWHACG
ncbi:MAG TPA: thermonuclease family protein [Solirubrobacteraceae bacterium]|nr:thermonuclease family protein [Solirubrobacteraceae bacterium]